MTLRQFRKSKGMTLKQLAGELGCSPSAISKWERNVDTIPDYIIDYIKLKFNVDIDKQYDDLDIYKKRIADLEDANMKLVAYGIQQEANIKKASDKLKELSAAVNRINQLMQEVQKILKGSD